MSKNFEEEYKALANEELPDLWNRIEDGLTPKTTQPSFLYRYRTVAVAALCVIVILPAVVVLGSVRTGRSKSWEEVNESAPMAADTTAADSWDEAAVEVEVTTEQAEVEEEVEDAADEAPAEAGGALQEYILTDEGLASGSAADAFDRAEHGRNEEAGAALSSDMAEAEAEKKMADEVSDLSGSIKEEAVKESVEKEAADTTDRIYEKVKVKVAQNTGEMAETDRELFCEVKMKVIKDPSGEIAEGTEISVWIAISSSMVYLEGEEYTLDLSYDPDRICPYRIA